MTEVITLAEPTDDELRLGLEHIRGARRRLRLLALVFLPASVLLGALAARIVPHNRWLQGIMFGIAAVWAMIRLGAYESRLAELPCPRCSEPFIGFSSTGVPRLFVRRCSNCWLYLDGRDIVSRRSSP